MSKHNMFIYENAADAFSYMIIMLVSTFVPTIISWLTDEPLYLLVSMFINSISLVRENLILLSRKKVIKRLWFERAIGIFASVIIATYNIIALCFWLRGVGQEIIPQLNIGFAILFFVPIIISGYEGILYTVKDYNENVICDDFIVAQKTTVDV